MTTVSMPPQTPAGLPADGEVSPRSRSVKLRSYLVLLVLGALVPLVAFSVFMVILYQRHEERRVEPSLTGTARALARAVHRGVGRTISGLRAPAASGHLDQDGGPRTLDQPGARL